MENSFDRSMMILDLFSEARALIGYRDVVEAYGFTKSSAYRYLGNLVGAGLIASVGNGLYSLGPRIIELERLIVLSDPLLGSGRRIMPALADEVPNSALLLCSLWGERVLCIHEVRSSLPGQTHPFEPKRGRGVPYTLFEGAASVVLLAHLPTHRLKSLFARNHETISAQNLGSDWRSFASGLKVIRERGYAASIDTFHTSRISVAVPVTDGDGKVAGCLARVAAMAGGDEAGRIEAMANQLTAGASAIGQDMGAMLASHQPAEGA